jgi:hypothetical protein
MKVFANQSKKRGVTGFQNDLAIFRLINNSLCALLATLATIKQGVFR